MRRLACLWVIAFALSCGGEVEEPPEETGPPTEGELCFSEIGCELPYFCAVDGCFENSSGTCIAVPEDCSEEPVDAVCACSGETFENRCTAHSRRRNVRFRMPCP